MLWLALYLPAFAVDARCRGVPHPGPLAVVAEGGRGNCLGACNPAALARGLVPGMPLSAARARAPEVTVLAADPALEAAALNGLAGWAGQFSSFVQPLEGEGVLLEVGGSRLLFGGLEPLWAAAVAGVTGLGYRVAAALAPTPLGAWYLARGAPGSRVTGLDALGRHLGPLPMAVMDLSPAVADALAGMGVRTLGALDALPRDGLARRLGSDILECLDRAWGRRPDPRQPHEPAPGYRARLALPVPLVETAALIFPLRRLLGEMEGRLRAVQAGVQRFTLELHHPGGAMTPVPVGMLRPTRDSAHCLELLRHALERLELTQAVEQVGLAAGEFLPLGPEQSALLPAAPEPGEGGAGLLERLRARLGPGAVRGVAPVADPRPERAWRVRTGAPPGGAADLPPGRRPLWLLDRPVPLDRHGEVPWCDGPLRLAGGPERIEGGWWDGADVARDYYVAETREGRLLWVYRERRTGAWHLHGLFS